MAYEVKPAEDKHAGGRPLSYETVAELEQAVKSYFDDCDPHVVVRLVENGTSMAGETIWAKREVMSEQKPYLITGLARYLGIDRKTLLNYSKIEQFIPTLDAARGRVEEFTEGKLYSPHSSGAQFSLKNNFDDWKDRSEIDHTSKDEQIAAFGKLDLEELKKLASE